MKINKDKYFDTLTGFKIPDSHFELGSNLHINDYYYIKRLFYNSFFTNRLAFLTANYILSEFKELIGKSLNPEETGPITLLGFDNHSELLISNLRKMLNDYCRIKFEITSDIFNHEVFTKDSLFLKNPEKIGRNIISIFPISTTFSTTVKVQNEIKSKLKKDLIFHNPVINLILIAQGEFDNEKIFTKDDIEWEYGWRKFDKENGLVEMESIDNDTKLKEKFFINLSTKWEKINECTSCYPSRNADEKCLVETKTSPVTPDLIFSFPKAYIYEDKNLYEYIMGDLNNPIIYRKHFKKHNNNFIYFIKTGIFLKKNKILIIEWIRKIGKEINIPNDRNTVIVTPSHDSNSGFVNLVNEFIFSDTATIVQYNPYEDYLYNFKKFYSETIETADFIIFVDDILFSTNTFNDINFYIKSINRKDKKGIDLCINLINRAGFYNYCKLIENLNQDINNKKIYSFLDINVSPLLHKRTYPFDLLRKKFEDLSKKAVLDEMRLHFTKRKHEFTSIDLSKDYEDLRNYGSPKALFQFLIFNELNKIFSYNEEKDVYKYKDLIKECFFTPSNNTHQELELFLMRESSINSFLKNHPTFKYEVKNLIYKVFSSEPFIHFKSIKSKVFEWVLIDLVRIVNDINKYHEINETFFQAKKEDKPSEYSKYNEFKFLLKRAVKLKMNYVYSVDVLFAIEKILKGIKKFGVITLYELKSIEQLDKGIPKNLFDDILQSDKIKISGTNLIEVNSYKPITTNGFITYYVGLLQELIIDHEAKALQSVVNVKRVINSSRFQSLFDGSSKNLKNTYNDDFLILLRRMVLENTFIFNTSSTKFIEHLNEKLTFDCLDNDYKTNTFLKYFEDNIRKYSFDYTRKMLANFNITENDSINPKVKFLPDDEMLNSFRYMLMLKSALIDDLGNNNSNTLLVKNKIETILKYCCKILNIKEGGAFFSVKYKNRDSEITEEDEITTVGEFYKNPNNYIKSNDIGKNSIIYNMFNGINRENGHGKFFVSCFELSLNNNGDYEHLKIDDNQSINNLDISKFSEVEDKQFKNLFFLKISEIISSNGKDIQIHSNAVICFYDNLDKKTTDDFIRFDPKKIRQLLLLRNDIDDFINHHFNNDSLRAYIEEQNQFVINKAITHSFETYVEQYRDALEDITDEHIRDKFDVFGTLILNKHFLLKFVAEFLKTKSLDQTLDRLDISKEEKINGNKFKELLKKNLEIIFSIHLTNYDTIDMNFVKLVLNFSDDLEIISHEFYYKELIFEIFYNIRKLYDWCVNDDNNLEIEFKIIYHENQPYLSISNNLFDCLPNDINLIRDMRKNMYNNKQKRGLSLINTISQILYDRECFINQNENIFELQIPIEVK